MYENNYPNNYESKHTESGFGNSAGNQGSMGNTYYYEGSARSAGGFQTTGPDAAGMGQEMKSGGNKKKKTSGGNGKKIVLGICCGLLFGIFAGLGFQAVTMASGLVKNELQDLKEASALPKTETFSGEEQDSGTTKAAADSSNQITGTTLDGTNVVQTTVTDITEVVKAVMPSVVSVNSKYVETTTFWGQDYSSEAVSTGSGIIVGQNDTELLLVTNYHVVASAEELTVQFVDGEQVQAQLKGSDADKDLAVIAVQLSDVPGSTRSEISIATLGNSDELTVGEPVIAIGNALGYGQSVTTGVVSALDRPIAVSDVSTQPQAQTDTEINTFIQTDAAINPGNSGGALLNIKGEVIGINSNKIGGSAVEGMGYAIPISDAQPIIEELMSKETRLKASEENKGYLGITGLNVGADISQMYGLPQGVYVSSVTEGTGAYEAGLVAGDIITAVNGEAVKSMDELKEELSYYEAGSTVELTIMQGSPSGYQDKTVAVTLGKQVSNPQ